MLPYQSQQQSEKNFSPETDLSGILLVDKPAGISSNGVVSRIRYHLGKRLKVGHAGTLDPLATGLLILLVGRATKQAPHFLGLDKSYRAVFQLGQQMTTDDSEGLVIEKGSIEGLEKEAIERALEHFRGEQDQVPPQFSAKKIQGQPAYRRARKGIFLPLAPARITIYRLQLISWTPPLLELEIDCSKGTYIRSLARDLGQQIGCKGFMSALRRTRIGNFDLQQAHSLDRLLQTATSDYRSLFQSF